MQGFKLSNTPVLPLPSYLSYLTIPNLPPNLATLTAIGYAGFYILLEPIAGSLISPIILGGTAYFNYLTSVAPSPTNQIAVGIFLMAWIAQFIGHGVFEGRSPALLDNLLQALVLAPFFVWIEALFMLGYRPELKARVEKAVRKEIEKYKNSKGSKGNSAVKNGR
jgi:2-hydroxy fatty acid dioxygenase